jgi:hypothetical protein
MGTTIHATLKPACLHQKASTINLCGTYVIQESRTIKMMHTKAGYNAGKGSGSTDAELETTTQGGPIHDDTAVTLTEGGFSRFRPPAPKA